MARVGVLLSGCGVQDGSEIHEAVLMLLALDEAGAEIVCMAPDKPQTRVVNHRTGEEVRETRNCLAEAARIARGKIQDVASVKASSLDAIVLPGGFGAALNLCNFAKAGADCEVDPQVESLLRDMHKAGKPIGAICISPALVARVFSEEGAVVTIGTDSGTADTISAMGAKHAPCPVDGVIIDEENQIITSPAYMLASSIKELRQGINDVVREVLERCAAPARR